MHKEILNTKDGLVIQVEPFKLPTLNRMYSLIPEIEKNFVYPYIQYFIPTSSVERFLQVAKEILVKLNDIEEWYLHEIIQSVEAQRCTGQPSSDN